MQTSWHKDLPRYLAIIVLLVAHGITIRYLGCLLQGPALGRRGVQGVEGIVKGIDVYVDAQSMAAQVQLAGHRRLFEATAAQHNVSVAGVNEGALVPAGMETLHMSAGL